MRYACIAALLLLAVTSSWAFDVSYPLSWTSVTKDVEGNAATPDVYNVYACDAPIADDRTCSGLLDIEIVSHADFIAAGNKYKGLYPATSYEGSLYFRVSAAVNGQLNGQPAIVESDLSNEASATMNMFIVLGNIEDLRVDRVIIITP